jgi:hypothetical protein
MNRSCRSLRCLTKAPALVQVGLLDPAGLPVAGGANRAQGHREEPAKQRVDGSLGRKRRQADIDPLWASWMSLLASEKEWTMSNEENVYTPPHVLSREDIPAGQEVVVDKEPVSPDAPVPAQPR